MKPEPAIGADAGLLLRSWRAFISFMRDIELDYTESDYLLERINGLEREVAELKRSRSEDADERTASGPPLDPRARPETRGV